MFTWNNYPANWREQLEGLGARYWCCQPERGVSTGTRHLQGVVCWNNASTVAAAGSRIHGWSIAAMRGTFEQAFAYCSKEETRDTTASFGFDESGVRPVCAGTAGGRRTLESLVQAAKDGATRVEILELFPDESIRYARGIDRAIACFSKERNFKSTVHWYYGPTGTGKSRAAHAENANAYWKDPCSKWYDGYEPTEHKCMIIDDYRCDFCTFGALLRLFDRYPYRVEFKGGYMPLLFEKIVVTAPKHPRDMWATRTEEDIAQLMRRIEVVKHFPFPDTVGEESLN